MGTRTTYRHIQQDMYELHAADAGTELAVDDLISFNPPTIALQYDAISLDHQTTANVFAEQPSPTSWISPTSTCEQA